MLLTIGLHATLRHICTQVQDPCKKTPPCQQPEIWWFLNQCASWLRGCYSKFEGKDLQVPKHLEAAVSTAFKQNSPTPRIAALFAARHKTPVAIISPVLPQRLTSHRINLFRSPAPNAFPGICGALPYTGNRKSLLQYILLSILSFYQHYQHNLAVARHAQKSGNSCPAIQMQLQMSEAHLRVSARCC